MSLLSNGDVAAMRGVLNQSLPDEAIVLSQTYVSDGGGGGSTSWAAAGTFDCRINPISQHGGEVVDRLAVDAQMIVTLPAGTDVATDDRIEIDAVQYEVLATRTPRSWEISRRVEVVEID